MKRWTALVVTMLPLGCTAEGPEVTLRLHHFLADTSPAQQGYLEPWAERVEEQSGGRIRVEIYPSMQLGGAPPSLIDQVSDGVVDLVWTLPGYTAGRFPITEAFELPFMAGKAEASSQALCEFYALYLQDEYRGMHPITLHTAGPGVFHIKGPPVESIDDLRGRQIRAPNRVITRALELLGAQPIGMPAPQVSESLSRGVIDGTLLPWEVTRSLRIAELVDSHTGFDSQHSIYTSTFLLAMNNQSYENLPDDLKAVIDANSMASGCEESRIAGANMDAADVPARQLAVDRGTEIYMIPADQVRLWEDAVRPLAAEWVAAMNDAGLDGATILQTAKDLIAKYEAEG